MFFLKKVEGKNKIGICDSVSPEEQKGAGESPTTFLSLLLDQIASKVCRHFREATCLAQKRQEGERGNRKRNGGVPLSGERIPQSALSRLDYEQRWKWQQTCNKAPALTKWNRQTNHFKWAGQWVGRKASCQLAECQLESYRHEWSPVVPTYCPRCHCSNQRNCLIVKSILPACDEEFFWRWICAWLVRNFTIWAFSFPHMPFFPSPLLCEAQDWAIFPVLLFFQCILQHALSSLEFCG